MAVVLSLQTSNEINVYSIFYQIYRSTICFPVTKKGSLSFSVHNCLECFFTYIVLGIKDSPYTVAFYNLYLNLKNSNKIKTEGNEAK